MRPPLRQPALPRLEIVDAARGLAVVAMIAYHVCFDLTWYGWTRWRMLDEPAWIASRDAIVASFLLVVGISLAVRDARERGTPAAAYASRAFLRRTGQIALAAALVTAGSVLLFPASFIYFGVLHFVVVALWICRRAPRLGGWCLVLGIATMTAGALVHDPSFDPKAVDWIGFAATKPITEDYVPLVPWLGVVLVGCGVGSLWARHGFALAPAASRAWATVPGRMRGALAATGRWSLTVYLVHQPLLLGAMGLVKRYG